MTFTKNKPKKKSTPPLTPEQRIDRTQMNRMKDRAAILSIQPLSNNRYQIWGGEQAHIVTVNIDGEAVCDCRGWSSARHGNCSHVVKYRLVYGDLRNPKIHSRARSPIPE